MQLSVIIINYNVKYYLEQCLHSVIAACKNISAEIIVVDNASTDNSIDYLQPKFPQVKFIFNEINVGFAKANNKALQLATGNFILYLNPDTVISEDIITNCISFLSEHKDVGAVGVKMIDGNGNFLPESKRAFPSAMSSFFKLSGMASLFPRSSIFNKYALGNFDENGLHEVDVLSGAFFLSGKEILQKLNGFDEDFFMYGEDIDLSYRIKKAGYKNFYFGKNGIVHFKGESTQKNKIYIKNFYGAMKIFVDKHYRKFSSYFLKAAISAGAFLSTLNNKPGQLSRSIKQQNENRFFVLYGDESAIQSAAAILSNNNCAFKSIAKNDFAGNDFDLNQSPLKSNVIFCLDALTYSSCIQFMQNNKNRFVYYWHYKNSQSIISGSNGSAISQIYIPI